MDGPVDWWWKMNLLDVCVQAGFCQIRSHIRTYGTDLTQRRTPSRVLGYHSRATRTRSSICIIGLELAVVLALERKMVRAVLKI